MANAQFDNISAVRKQLLGKMQTAQNIRINVREDVTSVLSASVATFVNSCEASKGEAEFYGKTNVKLLYTDGAEVYSANYNSDYSDRFVSDFITPQSAVYFDTVVLDHKTEINGNAVFLQLLIEVIAYTYITESVVSFSGGEGMFVKYADMEILTEAKCVDISADVSGDLTAKGGISSVLLAESNLCVTDYTLNDGVLGFSGEAVVGLLYKSGDKICYDSIPFDFKEEVGAEGIPVGQITLDAVVKNTRIRLDIAEEDENKSFSADISVLLRITSLVTGNVTAVADAYGRDCDFVFKKNAVVTSLPCGSASAKRITEQTVPVSQTGELVAVINPSAMVTKCGAADERAEIEGILMCTVLMKAENGFYGETLEVPYRETVDMDFVMNGCVAEAKAEVRSLSVKFGANPTVTAELCFTVDSSRQVEYQIISDVEEIPLDKTDAAAIEVCLARKGETLWQLAKGLNMSEEDIIAVNPDVTDPLESDARIVVYNKL